MSIKEEFEPVKVEETEVKTSMAVTNTNQPHSTAQTNNAPIIPSSLALELGDEIVK